MTPRKTSVRDLPEKFEIYASKTECFLIFFKFLAPLSYLAMIYIIILELHYKSQKTNKIQSKKYLL